jgi:hypothetical protein
MRNNVCKFNLGKKAFELKLFKMNKCQTLETAKHYEEGEEQGDYNLMHLYYNQNGHCGTWQRGGGGWVFLDKLGGQK